LGGGTAARIRSFGAGRALRCRDGPRDASTLTAHFVLARCPQASRAVRRVPSAAFARLRAAVTSTQATQKARRRRGRAGRGCFGEPCERRDVLRSRHMHLQRVRSLWRVRRERQCVIGMGREDACARVVEPGSLKQSRRALHRTRPSAARRVHGLGDMRELERVSCDGVSFDRDGLCDKRTGMLTKAKLSTHHR
jgi:hypothetical protein